MIGSNQTVDELSSLVKEIIDNSLSTEWWNKLKDLLDNEPALFFGVLDLRYLGKRRLEKLEAIMAYEQRDKAENCIEQLVYKHIVKVLKRKTVKRVVLYSIGYEAMELSVFIEKLKRNGIKKLIDVRENAISRKRGFAKNALNQALMEVGINYVHMKELGSPQGARNELHSNNNWVEFSKKYKQHLEGQREALVELSENIRTEVSCLMCFERDYRRCHRSLIADGLKKLADIEVVHL